MRTEIDLESGMTQVVEHKVLTHDTPPWIRVCSATTARNCCTSAMPPRSSRASIRRSPARLALEQTTSGGECVDPYVERLLEGFAFLAGRVHYQQDAEYARFTQYLLELVYPGYLAPTPSMLIAQLEPDLDDPALAAGPERAARQRDELAAAARRAHGVPLHHRPGRAAVAAAHRAGALPVARHRRAAGGARRASSSPNACLRLRFKRRRVAARQPARARRARAAHGRRRRHRAPRLRAAVRALPGHRRRRPAAPPRARRRARRRRAGARRLRGRRGAAAGAGSRVVGLPPAQGIRRVPGALPVRAHQGPARADRQDRIVGVRAAVHHRPQRRHAGEVARPDATSRCTARRPSTCSRSAPTASR